jgi:hypothetical protein
MPSPNKGNGSSDESEEIEQFFLKLRQMTDSPPLSEEFHERLRQSLRHISSSVEESVQKYQIPLPQHPATEAANSRGGKRFIWSKVKPLSVSAVILLVMVYGALFFYNLLNDVKRHIHNEQENIARMESRINSVSWQLQELERKNQERYEELLETISKFQDISHDPKAESSSKRNPGKVIRVPPPSSPRVINPPQQKRTWE